MSPLGFNGDSIKVYSGAELRVMEFPEDHCIIKPRMLPRGGKMVIGGLAKTGKTFLTLNLIRALLTGEHLFGHPEWTCERSKVLLLEAEVGPWGLVPRIAGIFPDVAEEVMAQNFNVLSMPIGFSLSSPDCSAWLKSYADNNGIDVIIYDPINKLHYWGENDSDQMLRLVNVLAAIGDGKRSTVIVHHFGKPLKGKAAEDEDPLNHYNFRGSSRLVDDPDALMTVHREPGRLMLDHESWKLRARLTLRHGPAPGDFYLNVNEHNDMRVCHRGELTDEDTKPEKNKSPKQESSGKPVFFFPQL